MSIAQLIRSFSAQPTLLPYLTPIQTYNNPNAYGTSDGDYFGYSVSVDGNYVVVGAYCEDDAGGTYSGKAYIFDVTTGSLLHILNNPNAYDTSDYDLFGYSVAISGNRVVVGAYQEDYLGSDSGSVYVYQIP